MSRSVNGSRKKNSACCAYFAQKILIQSIFFFRFLDTSTPLEFCFVPLVRIISTCWHLFSIVWNEFSVRWLFFFDCLKPFFDRLTQIFDRFDTYFRPDDTFNFRSVNHFVRFVDILFFSARWNLFSTSCHNFYRLQKTTFRSDDTFFRSVCIFLSDTVHYFFG